MAGHVTERWRRGERGPSSRPRRFGICGGDGARHVERAEGHEVGEAEVPHVRERVVVQPHVGGVGQPILFGLLVMRRGRKMEIEDQPPHMQVDGRPLGDSPRMPVGVRLAV